MTNSSGTKNSHKIFHLLVEARYGPMYWMHLEMRDDILLEDLDIFLRDIWLECCGHLSQFITQNIHYLSEMFNDFDGFSQKTMNVELGNVVKGNNKFIYEYDFGSTTTLALKIVYEREGILSKEPVTILARNKPPTLLCDNCQESRATQICTECFYEGGGGLCDNCAATHECDEEMFLPVVNSPRTGICGYTG